MESLGLLTDAVVTFGLRLACDLRTMPIFAFSCGLHIPIFYISYHDFLIACLYVCISEPLQKMRVRLWPCKTGLSPPVTLCY